MQTQSANACFGGTQSVYTHASAACACDMTFGLFLPLFLLFMKFLPMIAISEVKGVTPQADPHHPMGGAKHGGHY